MPVGRFHVPIPVGEKFGEWTVDEFRGRSQGGHAVYLCRCSCGQSKVVPAVCLRNGTSRSCGCWGKAVRAEAVSRAKTTHGMTHHPLYKIWSGMMDRCYKETCPEYRLYGARGIKVCERWHDPKNFSADMGERPTGHSIDRIDNAGDYEPGNCRWANQRQQMANVSYNVNLTFRGETACVAEWSRRVGIPAATIYQRMKSGWAVEKALTTPPDSRRGRRKQPMATPQSSP